VVWIKDNPSQIVTAYEVNRIKEATYPNLKRVY